MLASTFVLARVADKNIYAGVATADGIVALFTRINPLVVRGEGCAGSKWLVVKGVVAAVALPVGAQAVLGNA